MRHVNCKAKDNARIVEQHAKSPIGHVYIDTEEFQDYLETIGSFYVESLMWREVCFTARKEYRAGTAHWYGYKRFAGKLNKVYIGQVVTYEALIKAAEKLPTELWVDPKYR